MEKGKFKGLEDLVLDPSFRNWVTNPNAINNKAWNDWLQKNPEQAEVVEKAKTVVLGIQRQYNLSIGEKDKIRETIKAHLLNSNVKLQGINGGKKVNRKTRYLNLSGQFKFLKNPWLKVAASLIIMVMISYLAEMASNLLNRENYATDFGETRQIMLPDSSQITLNANSKLSFNNNWASAGMREVWLEGEAYFDIRESKHSDKEKFVVHTGSLDVEVLGTRFNVNNRHGQTEVVLNSGKIQLAEKGMLSRGKVFMQPGEKVVYAHSRFVKSEVKPNHYSAWKHEKLVFDGKSLKDIKRVIKDNFGLTVSFDKSSREIFDTRIKGTFPANNVEVLLKTLAKTTGTSIVRDNGRVIFKMDANSKKN